MSIVNVSQILSKVSDKKLSEMLDTYRAVTAPSILMEILDHLNVRISKEALGAIIAKYEIEQTSLGYKINLGGIIINGLLYMVELTVYNDGDIYIEMSRSDDLLLYRDKISS